MKTSKIFLYFTIIVVLFVSALLGLKFLNSPKSPFDNAKELLKQGKSASAIEILEKLSKSNPENSTYLPYLAIGYLHCDRIPEARTALETAIKLDVDDPNLSKVILEFANNYENKNDFAEAESLLLKASIDNDTKEIDCAKGLLYYHWASKEFGQNKYEQSAKHLNEAIQYKNSIPNQIYEKIKVTLAACYRNLGVLCQDKNCNNAIDYFERSLSYNDDPIAHYDLANLYLSNKNTKKALENYRIVVKMNPNNALALQKLIEVLINEKDYKSARDNLLKLINNDKSIDNLVLLAKLNLYLKNYPGAVKAYEDAVNIKPRLDLLQKLHSLYIQWSNELMANHHTRQANSVRGHALRVSDQIAKLTKEEEKKLEKEAQTLNSIKTPITVVAAKTWLSNGSLTPEAEIKIKNSSTFDIVDLSLQGHFYDRTTKKDFGCVGIIVANSKTDKFKQGQTKTLYFSCPNTVNPADKISLIIFWQNQILQELPIKIEK